MKIREVAGALLEMTDCDAVRHKIRVDLLEEEGLPAERLRRGTWYSLLEGEQRQDGGWGRFHSQDSRSKQRVRTGEDAVARMQRLGLKRGDPMADGACLYAEGLLADLTLWPDPWEKNHRFRIAVPLFIAGRLAPFGSEAEAFVRERAKWRALLEAALSGGEYRREDADACAAELLGVPIDGYYCGLNGPHALSLFGHDPQGLPEELSRAYLRWIRADPRPIPYLQARFDVPHPFGQGDWLALELLSRFPGFADVFAAELEMLLAFRGQDGLWDLGERMDALRIADDWRGPLRRRIDHSVFALEILRNAALQD